MILKEFISNIFYRAKKSLLVKTSFFNGIATFVSLIVGIISTKVVAVILGPSGVALLGNFINLFGMISTVSSGGINGGVTKYVAEYKGTLKVKDIFSTGLLISLITSFITAIIILFLKDTISVQIFYSKSYSWVFVLLALAIPILILKGLIISTFNGYKDYFKLIATNIAFSFITLAITIFMVYKYGFIGVVLSVIISALLTSVVVFIMFHRAKWRKEITLEPKFNRDSFIKLTKFAVMAFVAMFFSSFIQLMLRKYIIANISIDTAGHWQAVTRLTEMAISLFTMTLSIYFLPRFSEIIDNKELKKEIIKAICFISPLLILGLIAIYFLRNFVIFALFSEKFLPMEPLFLFQLIGSYFKVISWVLGYVIMARAMVRMSIFTEIFFGSSYFFLFIFLTNIFGIIGATYAFALNYLLYLVFLVGYFRKKLI